MADFVYKSSIQPDDLNFQEWSQNVLDEIESGFSYNDDSDLDPDFVSSDESNSEVNDNSDEEDIEINSPRKKTKKNLQSQETNSNKKCVEIAAIINNEIFYGRNKFKWDATPPTNNVKAHNTEPNISKVIGPAKALGRKCSVVTAWECLITAEILEEIVTRTNEKLEMIRPTFPDDDKYLVDNTDITEFRALLGLLFYSAIFKSINEDLYSLFATDGTGREIFRCTMSERRFHILLRTLRFDDVETREKRKESDPTAAISWVFERFIQNCKENYSVGENACVNEIFLYFQGTCKFPENKHGIKIVTLNDAKTHYFLDGYIYLEKGSSEKTSKIQGKLGKPTEFILKLVKSIEGTHRNITTNSNFSSIELIEELKKRDLTLVGTLKKTREEIPTEFLPSIQRPPFSSLFGFANNITLTSYVPKPGKAIVLVSSKHYTPAINENSNKPEIMEFYNNTKGGIDEKFIYSCNSPSKRWPMTIFYSILNISLVNAFVIYSEYLKNSKMSRFEFIKTLAWQLVAPELERRMAYKHLPKLLRQNIATIMKKEISEVLPKPTILEKRVRCAKCPRLKDNKTKVVCISCELPICGSCARNIHICEDCA